MTAALPRQPSGSHPREHRLQDLFQRRQAARLLQRDTQRLGDRGQRGGPAWAGLQSLLLLLRRRLRRA